MTDAQARTTGIRVSPRKVQLVADVIRGMSVASALKVLALSQKRGASILLKTLKSAVANAVNNTKADESKLVIKRLDVTQGQFLKRYHMSARGRIRPYTKRSTHITVIVSDEIKGGKSN